MLQVLLVDDCSSDPDAIQALAHIESRILPQFHSSSAVVRNTRRRHDSGSRNVCANFATGPYIAFMDSDNVAKPAFVWLLYMAFFTPITVQISTLLRALTHGNVDIVTCALDEFSALDVNLIGLTQLAQLIFVIRSPTPTLCRPRGGCRLAMHPMPACTRTSLATPAC